MLLFLTAVLFLPASAAAAPAETIPSPSSLLPLDFSRRNMVFTEGRYEGESVTMVIRQGEDPGVWLLKLGEMLEAELLRNDSGDLVLRSISSPEEQTVINYSPPATLLPTELRPAISIDQQVKTAVIDTQTGETEYRTSVKHTLSPPSRTTFYTPGGDYSGYQIDIRQSGSFGHTTIEASFSAGFVAESGLVHANLTYTTDKPLFFGDRHSHIIELAEPLPQAR